MMKGLAHLFFTVLILQALPSFGQDEAAKVKRVKKFNVRMVLQSGERLVGYIQSISDSSIQLLELHTQVSKRFHFKDINKIKVRLGQSMWTGILVGGVLGISIDALMLSGGYGAEAEIPVQEVLTIFSIPLAGMVIGAVVGSANARYNIQGEYERFKLFKERLVRKGYKHPTS